MPSIKHIAIVGTGALVGQWVYPYVLSMSGVAVDDNTIGLDDLVITATITGAILLTMMVTRG